MDNPALSTVSLGVADALASDSVTASAPPPGPGWKQRAVFAAWYLIFMAAVYAAVMGPFWFYRYGDAARAREVARVREAIRVQEAARNAASGE